MSTGKVKIHGKEYKTVALRVSEFRGHPETKDWSMETEVIENSDRVVMRATVKNEEGRLIGTGWAEEIRGSSNINKTSALENCETSCIGRALANIGLGGEEYASANEVSEAIIKQQAIPYLEYMDLVRKYFSEISATKLHIANEELELARSAFRDIPEKDADVLWKAPTKGGILTTEERNFLKGL